MFKVQSTSSWFFLMANFFKTKNQFKIINKTCWLVGSWEFVLQESNFYEQIVLEFIIKKLIKTWSNVKPFFNFMNM